MAGLQSLPRHNARLSSGTAGCSDRQSRKSKGGGAGIATRKPVAEFWESRDG